jgi:hypothetical protein
VCKTCHDRHRSEVERESASAILKRRAERWIYSEQLADVLVDSSDIASGHGRWFASN